MISQDTSPLLSCWADHFDHMWCGCFEGQNTKPLQKQLKLALQKVIKHGPNMGNADGKHTWVLCGSHMGTLRGKTHGSHMENFCILLCVPLVAAHVWPYNGNHILSQHGQYRWQTHTGFMWVPCVSFERQNTWVPRGNYCIFQYDPLVAAHVWPHNGNHTLAQHGQYRWQTPTGLMWVPWESFKRQNTWVPRGKLLHSRVCPISGSPRLAHERHTRGSFIVPMEFCYLGRLIWCLCYQWNLRSIRDDWHCQQPRHGPGSFVVKDKSRNHTMSDGTKVPEVTTFLSTDRNLT